MLTVLRRRNFTLARSFQVPRSPQQFAVPMLTSKRQRISSTMTRGFALGRARVQYTVFMVRQPVRTYGTVSKFSLSFLPVVLVSASALRGFAPPVLSRVGSRRHSSFLMSVATSMFTVPVPVPTSLSFASFNSIRKEDYNA